MTYKLVADSSANVLTMEDANYVSVPLKIITAQDEFVDDEKLDVRAMVDRVRETKGKSGTSCPNMGEWLAAFEGADRVFAVTITSNLSGSYAAAVQAAREYEDTHPGAKVCVIDSLSAGPELELILDRLARWIAEGRSFEDMESGIRAYQKHTHLAFSLESLTNLARNGRVSPAVAKIAGVLGIRVVGVASEQGTLEPLHKCRGEKKALSALVEEMVKRGFGGGEVRIAHCFNPEAARDLARQIRERFPASRIRLRTCTALCSFYAELGGLMLGFEDALA